MRSSIACSHCRRSKVRCVNQGADTTCEACQKNGRACDYAAPISGPSRRREASSELLNGEVTQKKKRKIHPSQSNQNPSSEIRVSPKDALDPKLLTLDVWMDMVDIYERNFATDLPFLHPVWFRRRLRQLDLTAAVIDPSPTLLLAFACLTVSFHKSLLTLLRSRLPARLLPAKPKTEYAFEDYAEAASKYYHEAACTLLGDDSQATPMLETTQALLMLGYHEWHSCENFTAWKRLGEAIRCAQGIDLHRGDGPDKRPAARPPVQDSEPLKTDGVSVHVVREVKRRTFWSCFIMDRYVSDGEERPQMINTRSIRIQLPCSNHAFLHGYEVKTMMLNERVDDFLERTAGFVDAKKEYGETEDTLAHFVRVLDLFGDILTWTCAGGRVCETKPPWDEDSQFSVYERKLSELEQQIPGDRLLNSLNTEIKASNHTLRDYAHMHAVFALCNIALHRQWVPFLPFPCKKPEGPLDDFEFSLPHDKSTFWVDSARKCFRAARGFNDFLATCQDLKAMPETPMVLFATYTVAVCVLYCGYFPRMDTGKELCERGHVNDPTFEQNWKTSREVLHALGKRLRSADGCMMTLASLQKFLQEREKEYLAGTKVQSPGNTSSTSSANNALLSWEEGGGGLKEWWEFFSNRIQNMWYAFSKCSPADAAQAYSDLSPTARDKSMSSSPNGVKTETGDAMESVPEPPHPGRQFVSVNGSGKLGSEGATPRSTNSLPNGLSQPLVSRAPKSEREAPQDEYHQNYLSLSKGKHKAQHVAPYPQSTVSAQRATINLNQQIQSPGMGSVSIPSAPQHTQQERGPRFNQWDAFTFPALELQMMSHPVHLDQYNSMPEYPMRGPPDTWMEALPPFFDSANNFPQVPRS